MFISINVYGGHLHVSYGEGTAKVPITGKAVVNKLAEAREPVALALEWMAKQVREGKMDNYIVVPFELKTATVEMLDDLKNKDGEIVKNGDFWAFARMKLMALVPPLMWKACIARCHAEAPLNQNEKNSVFYARLEKLVMAEVEIINKAAAKGNRK